MDKLLFGITRASLRISNAGSIRSRLILLPGKRGQASGDLPERNPTTAATTASAETTAATTTGISAAGAAAAGAAVAASNTETDSSSTDWGWIAFGILAAGVIIGGTILLVRKRHHAAPKEA